MAWVVLLGRFGALAAVWYGVYIALRGYRATYLYSGGLVWTVNGRARAAAWKQLHALYAPAGGRASADVVTGNGQVISLRHTEKQQLNPTIDRLESIFRGLRLPVLDVALRGAGHGVSERVPLDDGWITKGGAVVSVVGGLLLSYVLVGVHGLPGVIVAPAVALLFTGIFLGLGFGLDPRFLPLGYVGLGALSLIIVIVAIEALPGPPRWVVAAATVAGEAVIAAGVRSGHLWLAARRSIRRARRRP